MMKKTFVFLALMLLAWVGSDAQDGTELVLEQGVNDYEGTRDTTIYDESSNSNGGGTHLFAGQNSLEQERRALLAFDLSEVPEGATITTVSLQLTVNRNQSGDTELSLHRLNADWGEGDTDAPGQEGAGGNAKDGDATWNNNFQGESAWENLGGDFAEAVSAEAIAVEVDSLVVFEGEGLVADVQAWVNGDADNFGWILLGDGSANRFYSSNSDVEAGMKPRLVITFTN